MCIKGWFSKNVPFIRMALYTLKNVKGRHKIAMSLFLSKCWFYS